MLKKSNFYFIHFFLFFYFYFNPLVTFETPYLLRWKIGYLTHKLKFHEVDHQANVVDKTQMLAIQYTLLSLLFRA